MKTLEKIRDKSGHIRYKLDGKNILPKQARELATATILSADNVIVKIQREVSPDRLVAIKKIEALIETTFIIDHTVKVEGGVYARDDKGAELELCDGYIKVAKDGLITFYDLDIPESRFIAEMNAATVKALDEGEELRTFAITGNSGTIYTYDATTLEVINAEEPIKVEPAIEKTEGTTEVKLVDYVIARRQLSRKEVIKSYHEKKVA